MLRCRFQMLGDSRAKCGAHGRSLALEIPDVTVEHRHELQRSACDDGGGAPTAREHRDLAEDLAGTQRSYQDAVLEDVGRSGDDCEHREAEVPFAQERRSRLDLELRAQPGDALALVQGELGEHRHLRELLCLHRGDATKCFCGRRVSEW